MKPTVGRIVHYTLTHYDAESINKRRTDAANFRATAMRECDGERLQTGFVTHTGNVARLGDVLPAVIVHVADPAGTTVNLQVLLDGNDTYWATSRQENANRGYWPGYWVWPHEAPATLVVDELAQFAGAVASEITEQFAAGWPMVLPAEVLEALRETVGSHSWHGQFAIGPGGWSMGYIIRPDGKLHLELLNPEGRQKWQGTLTEAETD